MISLAVHHLYTIVFYSQTIDNVPNRFAVER